MFSVNIVVSTMKLIVTQLALCVAGNDFVLQIKLIDHIFDDMIVDNAKIRVILPEGSSNIQLETPYAVTRLPDSLHFTYLDTVGRPVVELEAKNLVESHIQDFKVMIK